MTENKRKGTQELHTVEFKIKEKGQIVNWENLPVISSVRCENSKIILAIIDLLRLYRCIEIRWNYAGSPMGHYVCGNVSRYEIA